MEMVMGLAADKLGIDISGMRMTIGVEVAPAPALRVEALNVAVALPRKFSGEIVKALRVAVDQCPLRAALRPDMAVDVAFAMP